MKLLGILLLIIGIELVETYLEIPHIIVILSAIFFTLGLYFLWGRNTRD
jgi:membrane-bound ClpP family serine protease